MKAIATTCTLVISAALLPFAAHAQLQTTSPPLAPNTPLLQIAGVPLVALQPNAPARYTDQQGDMPTIRLSPSIRSESVADMAVPTLPMHIIEAFMEEPLVVDTNSLAQAAHIVASDSARVMLAPGDQAYVRGTAQAPLTASPSALRNYRIFRQAVPLKDPRTQEVLGYEAQYIGQAQLLRSEATAVPGSASAALHVPATVRITQAKEEIRPGDQLLPAPPRQYLNFVPHAPQMATEAQVISLYGSTAMRYGTQYQVVAINKGRQDGFTPGMVFALMSNAQQLRDLTSPDQTWMQLPAQENGTAMAFRSFDRVSYALIMHIQRGVQVGDTLISAR